MTTDSESFEYDYERSRAAVAVACLQWLRCTGPTADEPAEQDAGQIPRDSRPIEDPIPAPSFSRHPLWDRWLDG